MSQRVQPALYFCVCDKCGAEEKLYPLQAFPTDWSFIKMLSGGGLLTWNYCHECTVVLALDMPPCIESKER